MTDKVHIYKNPNGRLFWHLTDDANAGQKDVEPFYSPEYVQSLLGRISDLESQVDALYQKQQEESND